MTLTRFAAVSTILWASVALADDQPIVKARVTATSIPGTPMYESWMDMKEVTDADPAFEFEYLIQGEMPGEEAQAGAVRRNRFQMGGLSWIGLSSMIPELSVTMAPFLFDSLEEAYFVHDNYLFEPIGELFEEKGLVLIKFTGAGWSVMFGDRPFLRPADLAGLKFRTSPNPAHRLFLEAAGADRISLSYADVVSGLQTGLIDGGLTSDGFYFFGILDAAPHVTFARLAYNGAAIFANREWFDSLAPKQRRVIASAYPSSPKFRELQNNWLKKLEDEATAKGIRIHRANAAERALWRTMTEDVPAKIIEDVGGRSRDLYEVILQGKAAYAARIPKGKQGF